jgi:hypothetical protein
VRLRLVQHYGGTLYYFTGRGFQTLFDAPLEQENHAMYALLEYLIQDQATSFLRLSAMRELSVNRRRAVVTRR